MESSQTRDRTFVPCIGRQMLLLDHSTFTRSPSKERCSHILEMTDFLKVELTFVQKLEKVVAMLYASSKSSVGDFLFHLSPKKMSSSLVSDP